MLLIVTCISSLYFSVCNSRFTRVQSSHLIFTRSAVHICEPDMIMTLCALTSLIYQPTPTATLFNAKQLWHESYSKPHAQHEVTSCLSCRDWNGLPVLAHRHWWVMSTMGWRVPGWSSRRQKGRQQQRNPQKPLHWGYNTLPSKNTAFPCCSDYLILYSLLTGITWIM